MEKGERLTAKITFLGTGGGRFVTLSQARSTGGWVLEMDRQMLHIDPGPGALLMAKKFGVSLKRLTCIAISHNHIDHYNDAVIVFEAMTDGARIKRGAIIGNEQITKSSEKENLPVFSGFHLKYAERVEPMKPGDIINIGNVKATATSTRHRDFKGIGFVFEGSRKIGYPSDGEYFDGQEKHFQGCDCIILNCLRPRGEKWPGHMNTEQAMELINKAKPKLAVLQHFGMRMLRGVSFKEAAWIQEQTGIKTIAAKDGMKLDI